MYSHNEILLVKHPACDACTELQQQLTASDTVIAVSEITLGLPSAPSTEALQLAKQINGHWIKWKSITPGYPFMLFNSKIVVQRQLAKHVCHSDLDDLLLIATEDWRMFPHYFTQFREWYDFETLNLGGYYELRDKIISRIGQATWVDLTTVVRLCIEHHWDLDDPIVETEIIQLIMAGEIRKLYSK